MQYLQRPGAVHSGVRSVRASLQRVARMDCIRALQFLTHESQETPRMVCIPGAAVSYYMSCKRRLLHDKERFIVLSVQICKEAVCKNEKNRNWKPGVI